MSLCGTNGPITTYRLLYDGEGGNVDVFQGRYYFLCLETGGVVSILILRV